MTGTNLFVARNSVADSNKGHEQTLRDEVTKNMLVALELSFI